MRLRFLFIFIALFPWLLQAQVSQLSIHVHDENGKTMPAVHVLIDGNIAGVTNANGIFDTQLKYGNYRFEFRFLGYKDQVLTLNLNEAQKDINIKMQLKAAELNQVVVSAGRYEQERNKTTVTVDVLEPKTIRQLNPQSIDQALEYLPGINISDGQISIRGGAGYSYGVGSRVLLLYDGLPMLSPDAGDVKWNLIPLNQIDQVEIVKGASSALYGSSALNGVINVLSAFPGENPESRFDFTTGSYLNPARMELKWWGKELRSFNRASFSDSRQLGSYDLMSSLELSHNAGYRTENYEDRMSASLKVRYRHPKIKGLNYGLGSIFYYQDKNDFFLWQNADEGAYLQDLSAINPTTSYRIMLDPFLVFYSENGGRHHLKGRIFHISNQVKSDNKDSESTLSFLEYQFTKEFKYSFRLSTGASLSGSNTIAELFGNHQGKNMAIFAQAEKSFYKNLSLEAGLRAEYFQLDKEESGSRPLLHFGVNYSLGKTSFFRASYGQGYRYPSVAEKFTYTNVGGLQILPNPNLKPENGNSSEIGFRQLFRIGRMPLELDIAGFLTNYSDMMEFTFGVFDSLTYLPIYNVLNYGNNPVGFQSGNVSKARISGFEISLSGKGETGILEYTFQAAYTYTDPVDLNTDSAYKASKSVNSRLLKYRYYHAFSLISNFSVKKFSFGCSALYNSHVPVIDKYFELGIILPGLKQYREEHNKGFFKVDFSLAYRFTEQMQMALQLKNAFNKEYMIRPGDIAPPRNLALNISWKF